MAGAPAGRRLWASACVLLRRPEGALMAVAPRGGAPAGPPRWGPGATVAGLGHFPSHRPVMDGTPRSLGWRGGIRTHVTIQDLPIDEIMGKADVMNVRTELAALVVQKMTVVEFCAICSRHNIAEPEALRLLSAFHDAGIVFNFGKSSNVALRETVFVKPNDVLDTVWATLDITGALARKQLKEREDELLTLKSELQALSVAKSVLDNLAIQRANRQVWAGSLIPITTFAVLFRMTWWEFSWDIVEPISFFVSTMGPICFFYIWFARHKEDFTMVSWRNGMIERSKALYYTARAFDIERYHTLIDAIEQCEEDIAALKQGF